jgi:hypothetical protein
MARFYFNFVNEGLADTDDEGVELPHLSAAIREAELAAREFLAEAIKANKSRVPEALIITDDSGGSLHTIPLTALLPEPLKSMK